MHETGGLLDARKLSDCGLDNDSDDRNCAHLPATSAHESVPEATNPPRQTSLQLNIVYNHKNVDEQSNLIRAHFDERLKRIRFAVGRCIRGNSPHIAIRYESILFIWFANFTNVSRIISLAVWASASVLISTSTCAHTRCEPCFLTTLRIE